MEKIAGTQKNDIFPLIIAVFAVLSYGRIWLFRNIMWDDNCWLLSTYASNNLSDFLNTGWIELRRETLGTFFYYFFTLHKNTNYFYAIWHSVNMVTQIATPIFLYLFVTNLFAGKRVLGVFIAISYVLVPFDYTLPYASTLNYRIGMMLSIISFYLTERALSKEHIRWSYLFLTFLISGLSHYIFMEGTIVFEPARLFLIGYIFHNKGLRSHVLMKRTITLWIPFLLLCIPLVFYKLTFKPYGIYEGMYKSDQFFFLNWKLNIKNVAYLLFFQWFIFAKNIGYATMLSFLLGLFSIFFSLWFLNRLRKKMFTSESLSATGKPKSSIKDSLKEQWHSVRISVFLGIILLFFSIALLNFAGREIARGMNSSHGSIAQFGYAIIIGALLYFLYAAFLPFASKLRICVLSLAIFMGLGVFFHNLNLDLYFNSWHEQNKFMNAFLKKFPALPDNAKFMIDASDNAQYYTQLDNYYKLEFLLNLFYASDADPQKFRRFIVYTIEEFNLNPAVNKFKNSKSVEFYRDTHLGKDTINSEDFIMIKYKNNELLVNREIFNKYPDVPYREWTDKSFPILPQAVRYPFRHKLRLNE